MLNTDADVWKVSIITGIFEPLGTNEINDEDAGNTNNNANDKEEKENLDFVSQKKRSLKYQMAPWVPVGQLFIVIYGDRGKTGLLPLTSDQPSDAERFQPGNIDCFKVISTFTEGETYPAWSLRASRPGLQRSTGARCVVNAGFAEYFTNTMRWLLFRHVMKVSNSEDILTFSTHKEASIG